MQANLTCYCAGMWNPREDGRVDFWAQGALVVDSAGMILCAGSEAEAHSRYPDADIRRFGSAFLLPGFVDTHVHLPQYDARAIGKGELLAWLRDVIFPLEERFADTDYARKKSLRFFERALAAGTTTMAVYCSSHRAATEAAFEAAESTGIRVCMGKSIMERGAPDSLLSTARRNIDDSMALAGRWHGAAAGRLQYVLTPRYAGSCSPQLLRRCAEISRADGILVQTHLSENPEEVQYIQSLFPEAGSYTDVYLSAGLLSERCIVAHAIHLNPAETDILVASNTAIAHCPCSNRFLQSGVMPLRQYLQRGLRIGLGTDVAGGYSLSLFNEQKEAIESSKTWNIMNRDAKLAPLSVEEALWTATRGGARALGLEQHIGSLEAGKEADFIVAEVREEDSEEQIGGAETLARLVYESGQSSIIAGFVRGKEVYHRRA